MKRFSVLTVFFAVLVIPSMLFAADKLAVGNADFDDGTVTIPLKVTNKDGLMAMDIPLKFSEGVTLREVTFENTRVSYFDLKIADIDNDQNTVAIGLISQIGATRQPDLAAGDGAVANLVFEVTDPDITEISLEGVRTRRPDHYLMYIYHDYDGDAVVGQHVEEPPFEPVVVAFANGVDGDGLPDSYDLNQNYPNPFNPTTIIGFALPVAGEYRLAIYNVLGQVVSEFEGYQEAGVHSIEWDASAFSSGVYFYKLSAGDFTETKKMMLLK
jgi:hypothetical protein